LMSPPHHRADRRHDEVVEHVIAKGRYVQASEKFCHMAVQGISDGGNEIPGYWVDRGIDIRPEERGTGR